MRTARRMVPALLLACLAACSTTPSHLTRLWPAGQSGAPTLGLSTEGGVVMLADPAYRVGDLFDIQFPVGNSFVREWGRLDRLNEDLAVVVPLTARLLRGRLATSLPKDDEPLYLALRDADDEPDMLEVERWHGGQRGSFIVVPGRDAERLARDYAGAGLYVERDGRWEIAGMLAGLVARDEGSDQLALGYVDLLEMARVLPVDVDYFEQDVTPLRPDIEFGVPLQPGDVVLPPAAGSDTAPPPPEEGGEQP
jgi:hypothetical protein